jgi:hypothetical protein
MTTRAKLFMVYPALMVLCMPGGKPGTSTYVQPTANLSRTAVAERKPLCGAFGDVMGVPEITTEIPYYGSAKRVEASRADPYSYGAYDWMLLHLCQTRPIPGSPRAAKLSRARS